MIDTKSATRAAGETYNHRIKIEKKIVTTSPNGIQTETWFPYCSMWASTKNLHGREFFEAQQVNAERTVKFKVRYRPGLEFDETMRILFDGKIYNITFVDNIRYDNTNIEIKAIEEVTEE